MNKNTSSLILKKALIMALFLSPKMVLSAPQAISSLPQQIMQAERIQGKDFVRVLGGGRLSEIAARYGRKPADIETLLLTDESVWLDKYGFIFFSEEVSKDRDMTGEGEISPTENRVPIFPLSQTFKLHSNPGSKRTIYLDFDGHTLTGTTWNGPVEIIEADRYSIDSDDNFSDDELINIQEIWMQVSEDYAPFDVDVTTEMLDEELIRRTDANDEYYGTRALITNDTFLSCNCGGLAYLGIYDSIGYVHDYYQPALIFSDGLGNGTPKLVAEAISHEVGHTFNLSHDGNATTGYYEGHGTGEKGWAPIMGVGYYQPVTQWSKGEYADANNTEDDMLIMYGHGLIIKQDDHTDADNMSATPLLVVSPTEYVSMISGNGVVERDGDSDLFVFESNVGDISINIKPNSVSPNLDVSAILFDSDNVSVASSGVNDKLGATINFSSPLGGTYYLKVFGSGYGDVLTTGYSRYGSIGRYFISGQIPTVIESTPSTNDISWIVPIIFELF